MSKSNFGNKINQYVCLIPIFGVVPSVIAIATQKHLPQLAKVSRTSLVLFLVWLASYSATNNSEAIPVEILNGSISSLYFLISLWLMTRVAQDKFPFDS
ncbi:MAG: hypothetical protein ACK4QL_03880 [Pseudanabaenaceae cyanobacterium]